MYARDLAEALGLIMDERGLPQSRLARELGVDQTWVSKIIRGKRDCSIRAASARLSKVGWEVRITPKSEDDEPVKRRDFVAGAASAFFIPTPKMTPFHDPAYVDLLTERTVRIHNEVGGDSLGAAILNQARKIESAAAGGSNVSGANLGNAVMYIQKGLRVPGATGEIRAYLNA